MARPNGFAAILEAFAAGARPDPSTSALEWSDRYMVIPPEGAAEPGPYQSARTPYAREILETLSASSPVTEVVLMFAAQLGKNQIALNWLAYIVDTVPGPFFMVLPTLDLAKLYSVQRLGPSVEATPRWRARQITSRTRATANAATLKRFRGGTIVRLGGANSPASLRSMPVRYLHLDEEDAYPPIAGDEGDPVDLTLARTATFGDRRKILHTSTPKIAGLSRIEAAFEASDRRRFFVPCPDCGTYQHLKFANLKFDGENEHAPAYACEACGVLIPESAKGEMLERGRWQPTNPEAPSAVRGYHLSALYSPPGWLSWSEIVRRWRAAQGRPDKLQVFVNTVLAETWAEKGEAPEWERLMSRREDYRSGTVPAGGLILTAGVDVQADRLEFEVRAWGPELESWSVDYQVVDGSPAEASTWDRLHELLSRHYPHEGGITLPIQCAAIDSGYAAAELHKFLRRHPDPRYMAIKGDARVPTILGRALGTDVNRKGKRIRRGLKVFGVGVHHAKVELYGCLSLQPPAELGAPYPPGFLHFPADYDATHFRQLCSEELKRTRTRQGFVRLEWVKLPNRQNPGGRNEVLDCAVYARAAAAREGLDRYTPEHWSAVREALGLDGARPVPHPEPTAPPKKPADVDPRRDRRLDKRGGGYFDRWRTP